MITKHFTKSDKYALESGIRALDEKLYRAKNMLLGGDVELMGMIKDEDGSISDEKVEALADEMVAALEEYRSLYGEIEPGEIPDNYYREGNMIVPDEHAPRLDPSEAELYRSFAYCAIYVAANKIIANGTFGEMFEIAENSMYSIGNKAADSEYCLSTDDTLELLGIIMTLWRCTASSYGKKYQQYFRLGFACCGMLRGTH